MSYATLRRVLHWDLLNRPGDYLIVGNQEGGQGLVLNCPEADCGVTFSMTKPGGRVTCEEPLTFEPSIVCPGEALGQGKRGVEHHFFIRGGRVVPA